MMSSYAINISRLLQVTCSHSRCSMCSQRTHGLQDRDRGMAQPSAGGDLAFPGCHATRHKPTHGDDRSFNISAAHNSKHCLRSARNLCSGTDQLRRQRLARHGSLRAGSAAARCRLPVTPGLAVFALLLLLLLLLLL